MKQLLENDFHALKKRDSFQFVSKKLSEFQQVFQKSKVVQN